MKRAIVVMLAMMIMTGALFAGGTSEKKVFFLINTTTSQYSGGYYKHFQEAIKKYPAYKWTILDGQENPTLQAQQMDEAIAQKASLIILWPQDSKALVAAAKKAKEAGIPVLNANNNLDKSGDPYITAYLTPDYYAQGRLAADAMAKALPNGGTFVHLGCDPSYEAARLRYQGFLDETKDKGYKLTQLGDVAKCDWQLALGKSNMTAFLAKFPGQINGVYAVDDSIGNGGLQAIQEDKSGKNTNIKMVSVGGIQAILDAIKDGKNYYATIYQSPMFEAPATVELAVKILKGEKVPFKNSMDTPIITKENAGQFTSAY
jgi:ribose transport system substrate-binding protein